MDMVGGWLTIRRVGRNDGWTFLIGWYSIGWWLVSTPNGKIKSMFQSPPTSDGHHFGYTFS